MFATWPDSHCPTVPSCGKQTVKTHTCVPLVSRKAYLFSDLVVRESALWLGCRRGYQLLKTIGPNPSLLAWHSASRFGFWHTVLAWCPGGLLEHQAASHYRNTYLFTSIVFIISVLCAIIFEYGGIFPKMAFKNWVTSMGWSQLSSIFECLYSNLFCPICVSY